MFTIGKIFPIKIIPSPNYRVDLGRPVSSSSANQHVPGRSGELSHQIWGYPNFFPIRFGSIHIFRPKWCNMITDSSSDSSVIILWNSGSYQWFAREKRYSTHWLTCIYIYNIFRPWPFQTYCPFMSICRFVDVLWHEALFLIAILDSCEAGILKTESGNLIYWQNTQYIVSKQMGHAEIDQPYMVILSIKKTYLRYLEPTNAGQTSVANYTKENI